MYHVYVGFPPVLLRHYSICIVLPAQSKRRHLDSDMIYSALENKRTNKNKLTQLASKFNTIDKLSTITAINT